MRHAKLVLRAFTLGDVAGDLGKTVQPSRRIVQGRDHDVRPKAGSVFAYAPAFIFEAPGRGGLAQFVLAFADGDILGVVEDREVASANLGGLVTLQAPRAFVPADDISFGIQCDDRMVFDVLDDQAEALFAFAQRLFGAAPLGQIARDFGETHHAAVLVEQAGDDDVGPKMRAVLTDAPAFFLVAPGLARDAQFILGMAAFDVLVRIKYFEALADDLVGFITFEKFGAQIPSHHVTVGIEQEDRVILDAGHEQAEILL